MYVSYRPSISAWLCDFHVQWGRGYRCHSQLLPAGVSSTPAWGPAVSLPTQPYKVSREWPWYPFWLCSFCLPGSWNTGNTGIWCCSVSRVQTARQILWGRKHHQSQGQPGNLCTIAFSLLKLIRETTRQTNAHPSLYCDFTPKIKNLRIREMPQRHHYCIM
jgi:hypothetical protein